MAYLYRLIALALALFVSAAFASFPAGTSYWHSVRGGSSASLFPSPAAACADVVARYNSQVPSGGAFVQSVAGFQCNWAVLYEGVTYQESPASIFSLPSSSCPVNSTLSGGNCTCTAPAVQNSANNGCEIPVDPAEAHCASIIGSPVKTSWSSTAPSLSTRTVCSSGGYGYYSCNATIEPDYCGSADGVTYLCHGSGTSAGGACTPSPAPEQPVPPTEPVSDFPSPPPPGTCPGQINGVTVNMPCNNSVSKGTKNEASNDGAGNTTTKSESRSTTCTAAGSCSTTVTTVTSVNGGAPVTSTKTIEESKGEFCVGNPAAKECGDGEGSSFGGSCESGFVCEGDAVQCAHAKETHLQNCKLNKDTPERQLYEASKGDDAEFDNDDVVNVGPSSFSQAPILGAASCISDKSITVMGSPVSLPFSRVCEYLSMLGNVLMAVGFLLSGRIIMRG